MGLCEEEAELLGEVVPCEGGAGDAFAKDEAVVDGSKRCGGGANVDYQGGGFAGREAEVFVSQD